MTAAAEYGGHGKVEVFPISVEAGAYVSVSGDYAIAWNYACHPWYDISATGRDGLMRRVRVGIHEDGMPKESMQTYHTCTYSGIPNIPIVGGLGGTECPARPATHSGELDGIGDNGVALPIQSYPSTVKVCWLPEAAIAAVNEAVQGLDLNPPVWAAIDAPACHTIAIDYVWSAGTDTTDTLTCPLVCTRDL